MSGRASIARRTSLRAAASGRTRSWRLPAALALLLLCSCPPAAEAQLSDGFESGEAVWQLAQSDCEARIVRQARTFDQKHSGQGSESVSLTAGTGTFCYLAYPIAPASIIEELKPSLWVLADRTGLQLMARVVFPNSRDPRSGQPLTSLVRGGRYHSPGIWQQLSISEISKLAQRQARVLRSQFGSDLDTRGAYVDLIVLNAYAGSGNTNLWIDDLLVPGFVRASTSPASANATSIPGESTASPRVRMQGSILSVQERPFFPCMIEYRGERFKRLKEMGFNTILLSAPASVEQVEEARQQDLWLVCPPPQLEGRRPHAATSQRVLAWYVGDDLRADQLQRIQGLAADLGRGGDSTSRPICGNPSEFLWSYSQNLQAIMLDSPALGGSLDLSLLPAWIGRRQQLARPGSSFWLRIPTAPDGEIARQWSALGVRRPMSVEPQQLRLLCYGALAAGARGICFQSSSSLEDANPHNQARVWMLERLNRELSLIYPWIAAGMRVGQVDSGLPQIQISALQTDRARLLLVVNQSPDQQYVAAAPPRDKLSLVIPNASSAPQVYLLKPSGLQPLQRRRVPGGIRIQLEQPASVELVVLTQDPLVINHLTRRLSEIEADLVRIDRSINDYWMAELAEVHGQLRGASSLSQQADAWLESARVAQEQATRLMSSRDRQTANQLREQASQTMARIRRAYWVEASRGFSSPVSSPLCVAFGTLPQHWAMARRMQGAQFQANSLAGGDMENLDHLIRSGWLNYQQDLPNLRTHVELSQQLPQSGRSSLHLLAAAKDRETAPTETAMESSPIRVVSGQVPVRAGQVVRVQGWVRTAGDIQGSFDGLLVYDSLGGRSLGRRVTRSDNWEPFTLYRAAPADAATVQVIFELTGMGEVWIDNVSIALYEPPDLAAARQAADRL